MNNKPSYRHHDRRQIYPATSSVHILTYNVYALGGGHSIIQLRIRVYSITYKVQTQRRPNLHIQFYFKLHSSKILLLQEFSDALHSHHQICCILLGKMLLLLIDALLCYYHVLIRSASVRSFNFTSY